MHSTFYDTQALHTFDIQLYHKVTGNYIRVYQSNDVLSIHVMHVVLLETLESVKHSFVHSKSLWYLINYPAGRLKLFSGNLFKNTEVERITPFFKDTSG